MDKRTAKWRNKQTEKGVRYIKAIDEAGITRPEGLKEVVDMLLDRVSGSGKVSAALILNVLGVAPKQEDE